MQLTKTAFELSLSKSQRFGRFAVGAIAGYLATEGAEKLYEAIIKWKRTNRG